MLYVYALLAEPPGRPPGRGLRGERLGVVDVEGLWAVAGTMPTAPSPSVSALRRHDAVVRRLARATDAVLPVRFGTVLAGRAALARALAGRGPTLRRALRLVRGREQMTLRVFGVVAPAPRREGTVPDGRPGTRYLAARLATAVHRRTVPELDAVRRGLAPLVRAERVERHDAPPLVATVYHLVDRGRSAEYLARLDRAAPRAHPVRVQASGPWPAYAFGPEPPA